MPSCCYTGVGSATDPFHCKTIRLVTMSMREKYDFLPLGRVYICSSCRILLPKRAAALQAQGCDSDDSTSSDDYARPDTNSEVTPIKKSPVEAVAGFNSLLESYGCSPTTRRKLSLPRHRLAKLAAVDSELCQSLGLRPTRTTSQEQLNFLKTLLLLKMRETKQRAERIRILTVAATFMTVRQIQKFFSVRRYPARQAAALLRKKGVLSVPDPAPPRRKTAQTIIDQLQLFWKQDHIGRPMPGAKDFISVKITLPDGTVTREHRQKRLVMDNMDELLRIFRRESPDVKISLSTFAKHKPPECVFAAASGTHSVCVCTKHQNLLLMVQECGIKRMKNTEGVVPFQSTQDLVGKLLCEPETAACSMRTCDACQSTDALRDELTELLDFNDIDKVTYYRWNLKGGDSKFNRCVIEKIEQSAAEYVDVLCEVVSLFIPHQFMDKQQTSFLKELKNNLKEGEFIVVGDFAENYAFVLQDAAQSFHWNNRQASIHTFVAYYREGDKLKTYNHSVISECQDKHNTITVHMCQRLLMDRLKAVFPALTKVYYMSDGAASQYKNYKIFVNLYHHLEDFGVPAEWHFFESGHGKGPCDGIGGSLKRLARLASLKRPYRDQITNPHQLYEWARGAFKNVHVDYITEQQYETAEGTLIPRFATAKTVPGTQGYHSVIPDRASKQLEMRLFSASQDSKLCKIFKKK